MKITAKIKQIMDYKINSWALKLKIAIKRLKNSTSSKLYYF